MTLRSGPTVTQNPLTVVRLLACGHGQTCFVEIYNDGVETDEADFLGLVNCGGQSDLAQQALDYIESKVGARYRKLLNLVVVTNQSERCTNLFGELGDRLAGVGAGLITAFVAPGQRTGQGPDAVKRFLEKLKFGLDRVEFAAGNQSDYLRGKDGLTWIAEHSGTYFRILASSEGDVPPATVLVVDNGLLSVVLPGATSYEIMRRIKEIPALETMLSPVAALALPLAGSLNAAVRKNYLSPSPSAEGWKTVTDFVAALAPQQLGISAGPKNATGEPLLQTFNLFRESVIEVDEHSVVYYDLAATGAPAAWVTRSVRRAIGTTVQSLAPRVGYTDVGWQFRLEGLPTGPEQQANA